MEADKAKIFIVDDEPDIISLYQEYLGEDFNVKGFLNPLEMADLLKSGEKPNLIVSDYKMPNCTGIELARKVRDLKLSVPLLLVSGYLEKELMIRAMNLGVYRILEKPFDGDEFELAVRQAVAFESLARMQSLLAKTSLEIIEATDKIIGGYKGELDRLQKLGADVDINASLDLAHLETDLEVAKGKLSVLKSDQIFAQRILGLRKTAA